MKTIRRRFCLRAAVVLVAALVVPMIAAGQITCNASSLVPSIVRVDGKTEPVGDVVVTCTDGVPTDTYDGIANAYGTGVCGPLGPSTTTYGCGRPNAFQGQLVMSGSTTLLNAVVFPGVPFDPPGGGSRVFHFTNLRANASIL